MLLENVCSGSIHKVTSEQLSAHDECEIRVIHASTDDSGYGGMQRRRGWPLGIQRDMLGKVRLRKRDQTRMTQIRHTNSKVVQTL